MVVVFWAFDDGHLLPEVGVHVFLYFLHLGSSQVLGLAEPASVLLLLLLDSLILLDCLQVLADALDEIVHFHHLQDVLEGFQLLLGETISPILVIGREDVHELLYFLLLLLMSEFLCVVSSHFMSILLQSFSKGDDLL